MTRQLFNAAPDRPPSRNAPATRLEWSDTWAVLDQLPGSVVLLDAEGTVVYLNGPAELRLDLPRSEVIGRDLFRDLFPHLEQEGYGSRYRQAMTEEEVSLAWEVSLPVSATPRTVGIGIRALMHQDRPLGVLLLEDRSALAAERARRRQAEQLAAVGELANGVAHEINNPLATIKSFAQLLSRDATEPEQAQALEIISSESSRIARVIHNLLTFAGKQADAEPEAIDLSDLAQEVLALKRYALETAGVEVETDFDPSPSRVRARVDTLQRVVLGLLSHAEQALLERPEGRRLTMRTRESTDGVALYLVDNGPGIERDRLPTLFSTPGAGYLQGPLGLDVIAALVQEEGGQIWADSVQGRGTAFCVRVPRVQAPVEVTPVREAPRPVARAGPLRVLVADDEDTLRLALSLFLGRQGHQVTEAADAHEALRLAQSQEFDVAMVDVRMPGDGLTLLDQLESMPRLAGRTILMTGDATHVRVRDRIRSGNPSLVKPFDMTEAVALIEALGRPS